MIASPGLIDRANDQMSTKAHTHLHSHTLTHTHTLTLTPIAPALLDDMDDCSEQLVFG